MMLRAVGITAWFVALSWVAKVVEATFGMPRIPRLTEERYDVSPEGEPTLTAIVPARNEELDVGACLRSLLGQDYPRLEIVAVNDRSTDATGVVMDEIAAGSAGRLRVLHLAELPPEWLGKTHAMAVAAAESSAEWLLFTDADVLFREDALRRSLAYAVAGGADHLVTVPTPVIRRWDEGMMLGFFQVFGMWGGRPWKVANPKAKLDAIGIGAFNLVRRTAYEQVGGFAALRMEVIEDIGFGRRIKRAGLAQRIAFAPGLVSVHWASGAFGLVEVMTKNLFSAFRFYVSLALGVCVWLGVFCAAPVLGLLLRETRLPAVLTLLAIGQTYRLYGRVSGISAWQAMLSPVAAVLFVYTLLRSMARTLRQGGVVWERDVLSAEDAATVCGTAVLESRPTAWPVRGWNKDPLIFFKVCGHREQCRRSLPRALRSHLLPQVQPLQLLPQALHLLRIRPLEPLHLFHLQPQLRHRRGHLRAHHGHLRLHLWPYLRRQRPPD